MDFEAELQEKIMSAGNPIEYLIKMNEFNKNWPTFFTEFFLVNSAKDSILRVFLSHA